MGKHYPIEIVSQLTNTVYYPVELQPLLRDAKKISFGSSSCKANITVHPEHKNRIVISSDLQESLHFPNINMPIHVFYENSTLILGPLVGIFTSGFTPFPLRPLGNRSMFFSKLLNAQPVVGISSFVFGEQHINWDQQTIDGLFYHDNRWESYTVPFPNVCYDRLPNRRSEKQKENQMVKQRFTNDYSIPWYNTGFFNKLDIYEKLYNDANVYTYLPETVPFTSFAYIESMLSDYTSVYIKPTNGSLGFGVHQILFDKDTNLYYCRYHEKDGTKRLQKFSTLENLMNYVFHNKHLENMLVQQGISLIKIDNRQIDFRIHTNKDENGQWLVTAIAAKMAGPGCVTTHVNTGGEVKTIDEVLNNEEKKRLLPKLKEAALKLSYSLEKRIEGNLGEIGFDLGVDKDGQIWLFEANSKPGRSIFNHPNLKEYDLQTRKMALAYAIHLTEKHILTLAL
ncbi:YheC/YheD family endospore coat-associated protein [Pseudoneobacillus sp. C159]